MYLEVSKEIILLCVYILCAKRLATVTYNLIFFPQQVEELKQQGNECVKGGKYSEAILHYTHAIQLDKTNHLLYSNRSLAFLKLDQYYFALEDAKEAIKLQPNWPKVILASSP